jgi:hypothetical protein
LRLHIYSAHQFVSCVMRRMRMTGMHCSIVRKLEIAGLWRD